MRTKLTFLALLALLVTAILPSRNVQATAPAPTDPIPAGQIGGVTSAVVYSSNQVFFNIGPRISRMSVAMPSQANPASPVMSGAILPGIPQDIKDTNGFIYAALGAAGVAVVDAMTLATLDVKPLPVTGSATAIAVGSQRLYVAAGNNGIIAFDLGVDKKTLTYAQTLTFTNPARQVTDVEIHSMLVSGVTREFLFATANNGASIPADRGGVLKFDITDSPILGLPTQVQPIDANAVRVTDAYVYAVGDAGFYSLDTAFLGTTGVSATLSLAGLLNVALSSDEHTAYVMGVAGGIDVVDVSAPLTPILQTPSTFFTNGLVKDLAVVNLMGDPVTHLYVADYFAGLSVVDSPQATRQPSITRLSLVQPQPAIANVVAVAYPQAFVYGLPSTMLSTINAPNTQSLSPAGAGITPTATFIRSLTTFSNTLLASADTDGLLRYAINPGSEPSFVDAVNTVGNAYAAAVSWPLAAVANGTSGLAVVDLSLTDTMVLTGSAPPPLFNSDFRSVDVAGHFAYVGDYSGLLDLNAGALRVYDLSDPTAPVAMGVLSQTGILDVKVSDYLAFMAVSAGEDSGLRVVDVTNPASPTLIPEDDIDTFGQPQGLAIYRNFLFVAEADAGVQVFSFGLDGLLTLVANIPTSGSALQVAAAPGYLYVADENAGLMVFAIGNDLALTKNGPDSAYAGQTFAYTLSVDNVGPLSTTNVVVTDVLPANLAFVSGQGCANTAGTVTCTAPSLAIGGSVTFSVVVSTNVAGVYTNTATVDSSLLDVNTGNDTSSAMTTVLPAADLSLRKTSAPFAATWYMPLTYTLQVVNHGPSNATGVVVTDTLPATVQFMSASGGACSGTSEVVCNLGSLSASSTTTVTIVVQPISVGSLDNTALVSSDVYDPDLSNNTARDARVRLLLPMVTR